LLDEDYEIPLWFIVDVNIQAKKITGELHFPPYKHYNYRELSAEYKEQLELTVKKVRTLIMLNELRGTLICPDNLKIGKENHIKRREEAPVVKNTSSSIGMGSMIRKRAPMKKMTSIKSEKNNTTLEGKKSQTTAKENKEVFEVPLIYKDLFPVYERIRRGEIMSSLGNYGFFKNFRIANIENAFLSFNDKEIYILVLNEIDNPYYQKEITEVANPEEKKELTDDANLVDSSDIVGRDDLINSKIILVLRVYSLEDFRIHVIKNFVAQIDEFLTLDSIRCFATVFLKTTQIKFNQSDIDYLAFANNRLVTIFFFLIDSLDLQICPSQFH